jgi:predicted AlkP superfamily phosphohydrolase/phosphomutase
MTTVVLGLDGAAFELIDRWIDDGTLPTFARLVDDGAATNMQSCPPPVTCPNWQCYATGTNPGKLGVFWWEHVDRETQSMTSTSAGHQFDGHYYWEYLDDSETIINLPTSYPPPEETDGVHIAGGPGAEQSGYTTPPALETKLVEEFDYAVHPENIGDLSAENPDSPCVDEIYDLIETRFDVVEASVTDDDTEFVHCTIFYLNVLQHFYWDHDMVRDAWKRIDSRLAELLATDAVETLYVMSDHGSNEIERTFHVNAWLEREGYLETTTGLSDLLHSVGLTRERIRPVIASLGIEWWLRRLVPRRIQTMLPDAEGGVTEGAKANIVDWDQSVALASGQGPLYILATDTEERERVREELLAKLDGLEHEGRPIIEAAVPGEDVYEGPHLDRAPDIVLHQAPGVHIAESLGGDQEPFEAPTTWRGENKDTGLFLAHGPDIDPDADLTDMHILDIAPTVLHHCGEAVPSNLDGEVRTDLFVADSEPATRDPATQPPVGTGVGDAIDADEGEVSERLSNLGYLQ